MVNLQLSYDYFSKRLQIFPQSKMNWLNSHNIELPDVIMNIEDYSNCETITKLCNENDFPNFEECVELSEKSNFDFLGEVIQRTDAKTSEETVDSKKIKLMSKARKKLSKLKSAKQIEDFIKGETKLRKENRKVALTKTLEQKEWKFLRTQIKGQLEGESKIPAIIDYFINYVVCSTHQGQECPEIKSLKKISKE